MSDIDSRFIDPLAAALSDARQRRAHVSAGLPWSELTPGRAEAIGAELYGQQHSDGPSAWKMGAFDSATQERLVLDGPLVAPVLADGLHVDVTEVHLELARFAQPKLEAEVGVLMTPHGNRLMPCVEVADCRFPGWAIPAYAAVADFGLQGAMLFGNDVAPLPLVHVTVRHDDQDVQSADCAWDEAVSRLRFLPSSAATSYVATGAMTSLIPATVGRWDFDFQEAGRLCVIFA
jgi:2-keto-4-pentenoate hydratase